MLNTMVKVLYKTILAAGILFLIVYILLYFFVYSRSPKQAIQKKLGGTAVQYTVNNDGYVDKDGSRRFVLHEWDGKFTDSLPHIFYLKQTSAGWLVVNYGNAP